MTRLRRGSALRANTLRGRSGLALILLCAVGFPALLLEPPSERFRAAGAEGDPTIVDAGDIARCAPDDAGTKATAALLDGIAGTVLPWATRPTRTAPLR